MKKTTTATSPYEPEIWESPAEESKVAELLRKEREIAKRAKILTGRNILFCEYFLQKRKLSEIDDKFNAEKERIMKEYNIEAGEKYSTITDCEVTDSCFRILLRKFPEAKKFKNFRNLFLAAMYEAENEMAL